MCVSRNYRKFYANLTEIVISFRLIMRKEREKIIIDLDIGIQRCVLQLRAGLLIKFYWFAYQMAVKGFIWIIFVNVNGHSMEKSGPIYLLGKLMYVKWYGFKHGNFVIRTLQLQNGSLILMKVSVWFVEGFWETVVLRFDQIWNYFGGLVRMH